MLVAGRRKTVSSQLTASNAFVQFHLRDSLFTAGGATKHAAVKCVVFQIDEFVGQSLVEVK